MFNYINQDVVQNHCALPAALIVENDWNFLPYHRVYLEGLEDYLYSLGFPYRDWVPLPKWLPNTTLQLPLRFNDPECRASDPELPGPMPEPTRLHQRKNSCARATHRAYLKFRHS